MPNKQRMKSWGVIAAPPMAKREGKRGGVLSKVSYLNPAQGGTTHTHTVQAALISH